MTGKLPRTDGPEAGFSLRRWSRRKLEATRTASEPPAVAAEALPVAATATPVDVAPPPTPSPADELPPVESLTFDSDFAGFLRPGVDESLKRAALKQLFRDPRFNVMDGLDTYIDDYTKSDPIPPQMMAQLMQGRYIFDPPKTMVTAEGHVVDVPPEALAEAADEPAGVGDPGATVPTLSGASPLPAGDAEDDHA